MYEELKFEILKGKTLTSVKQLKNDDDEVYEIVFHTTENKKYRLYHSQSCCESVFVESIVGDLEDLLNTPILTAEESSNDNHNDEDESGSWFQENSETWTFYKLSTIKGSVTIRWYGSSNGYYSESVEFEEVK